MAAENFWVRYAQQFSDYNLNLLMTVELRTMLSITLCLYGSHTEIDQLRAITIPTSEVAIGHMSSFKQNSGVTVRVTDKILVPAYPNTVYIRSTGIPVDNKNSKREMRIN
uniref:Uncharacterized protein n=2 Tax=Oryza sativa subsp. japonica TaxID=39947 RepID=Q2R5E3_ORYSJ|nr:hypothetical protein LOC_Os11g25300 [Oryza sativa Japonica Group]ABA93339.1 hypothetical protein LOC_Os11g25300 [Oryza sativa Japonica Group]